LTRAVRLISLLLAVPFLPRHLSGQAAWTLDLSAGYVSYQAVSAHIGAGSLIAGARRTAGTPTWLYLYGGSPLDSEGVFWAAGGAGQRLAWAVGPVWLGADLGAHLVGYRDTELAVGGGGATLEALPLALLQRGRFALEFRSGLLQHTDLYDGDENTRRVHHTGLQLGVTPSPTLRVLGDTRYLRAEESDYPFAGVTVEAMRGPLSIWGSAGRWLTDTLRTPAYGVGVAWRARTPWEVQAGWQQETYHPLYWNLPRRTWSVRLSRALGRAGNPAPSRYQVVERDGVGSITIRLSAGEAAGAPAVLGEFTDWQPVVMVREGNYWVARLPVEPGVYRYGFQDAAGQWFLPESLTQRVDDGMGGSSAVLIVP
jgi:hypothetical protein